MESKLNELTLPIMKKETFTISGEYIELLAFLKAVGLAETGGHAKFIVDEGEVVRNGEVEYRRRAKLIPGDELEIDGIRFLLE
jgi:ribosome-associated protein